MLLLLWSALAPAACCSPSPLGPLGPLGRGAVSRPRLSPGLRAGLLPAENRSGEPICIEEESAGFQISCRPLWWRRLVGVLLALSLAHSGPQPALSGPAMLHPSLLGSWEVKGQGAGNLQVATRSTNRGATLFHQLSRLGGHFPLDFNAQEPYHSSGHSSSPP